VVDLPSDEVGVYIARNKGLESGAAERRSRYAPCILHKNITELTTYLENVGLADVMHTHADLLSHLVGVYKLLERWEMPGFVCRAMLFHSIYGTEGFPHQSLLLSKREQLSDLIGGPAEKLTYTYCAMTYDSLQASVNDGSTELIDRFLQERMELSEETYREILWIKLADACEQATERTWENRFFAKLAKRLGPDAQDWWSRTRHTSDVRQRKVASPHEACDLIAVLAVVRGPERTVDGLHVERMAKDEGDAFPPAEVG
jgi:hypothetical protein